MGLTIKAVLICKNKNARRWYFLVHTFYPIVNHQDEDIQALQRAVYFAHTDYCNKNTTVFMFVTNNQNIENITKKTSLLLLYNVNFFSFKYRYGFVNITILHVLLGY